MCSCDASKTWRCSLQDSEAAAHLGGKGTKVLLVDVHAHEEATALIVPAELARTKQPST